MILHLSENSSLSDECQAILEDYNLTSLFLDMSAENCDYEAMGLQSLRTPSPKQQSRPITPKNSSKQTKIRNIKGKVQRVAYHKLFSFADKVDYVLMVVGGTAAVLHGAAVPVFFIYFSRLINDLGHSMGDPMKQTAEVSRVPYLNLNALVSFALCL